MGSNPLVVEAERILASQYVSAVGLVILLWDHMLTFGDEVNLIWTAKLSIPKVLFFFNRYAVPIVVIFQTYEFSGIGSPDISDMACKVGYSVAIAVGMLSIASSNFLVLLRLWVLWDRSRRLMIGTLALYILTQMVAMGLTVYVTYNMFPTVTFEPLLHICTLSSKPDFVMLWCPGIAFEVMIFITIVWNAMDRPRSVDEQMTKIMYRDGSAYFLGLFVLRLVNLLLSVLAPLALALLGVIFLWSISNITLTRLILNLRRHSLTVTHEADYAGIPVLYASSCHSSQGFELQKIASELSTLS